MQIGIHPRGELFSLFRSAEYNRGMNASYCVYIMTNQKNGTLYIGVTNNLIRRVNEHKQSKVEGFTKQHSLHMLVHYEIFSSPLDAIKREKQLKEWKREWKMNLIERQNPLWVDLYNSLL